MNLQLINTDLLQNYIGIVPLDLDTLIINLSNKKTSLTKDSFDFYTSMHLFIHLKLKVKTLS